jgi:Ca2+-binding RTX toxin-like protein
VKVNDSIQSSREKIANLKAEKMNDTNSNFIGEYLFDNENSPPAATTRMLGEEDDSLPPVYDNNIYNYGHDNQRIKGSEGNDLIYNDGNKNRINTGDGADQVFSNGKNNIIRTGSGDDNISLSSNSGGSKIRAGQGDDNILVNEQSQGSISIKGGSGDDTVTIRGDEADYKLSIDARTGNRKYIHKTNGSEINIAKDVENIDFQRTRFEPQE